VDQHGEAVPNATVNYSALDAFEASGSKYGDISDSEGRFKIEHIHGAVLSVGVRKTGYYPVLDKSNASFAYGMAPDSQHVRPPTEHAPALFVLQKGGLTEALIHGGGGQIDVPAQGLGVDVDLVTGKLGHGDLHLRSWTNRSDTTRFDWGYDLAIAGGGVVEKKPGFEFEAPEDGYTSSVDIRMPATAEAWSSTLSKEYFARLADGRYARCSIDFYAGKRCFVVLTTYVNPRPGHRNLEFDPAKQIAGGKK